MLKGNKISNKHIVHIFYVKLKSRQNNNYLQTLCNKYIKVYIMINAEFKTVVASKKREKITGIQLCL